MTDKTEQKLTDCILSRTEVRLLEALIDPDLRMKNITEICKMCKISRTTYYNLLGNPDFFQVYQEVTMDIIKHKMAQLANALVKEAVRGSAPHLKMALEICGIYSPGGKGKKEPEQEIETYEQRRKRLGLDHMTPQEAMKKYLLEWAEKEGYEVVKKKTETSQ
jgi:hypothetical protein